jgi:hypothetical protein
LVTNHLTGMSSRTVTNLLLPFTLEKRHEFWFFKDRN